MPLYLDATLVSAVKPFTDPSTPWLAEVLQWRLNYRACSYENCIPLLFYANEVYKSSNYSMVDYVMTLTVPLEKYVLHGLTMSSYTVIKLLAFCMLKILPHKGDGLPLKCLPKSSFGDNLYLTLISYEPVWP